MPAHTTLIRTALQLLGVHTIHMHIIPYKRIESTNRVLYPVHLCAGETLHTYMYTCFMSVLACIPGCLCGWFKDHVKLLQAVLPMILDALRQPSLAPSAALAFRDVCGDCASQLVPVVTQLIPVCQVGPIYNTLSVIS